LVVVVRPQSCGCTSTLGLVFVVRNILDIDATCTECGIYSNDDHLAQFREDEWVDLSSLKKIPPLSEPSHTEHREEIEA
jgi:hypothetical protein